MAGKVMKINEGNALYVKEHFGFDPFQYAGECARIEAISREQGDLSPQHCMDPRTGKQTVSGVSRAAPGLAKTSVAMKERQRQYLADDLEKCRWDFDRRSHCDRLDDPNGWEEILRVCDGVVVTPEHAGMDYEGDGGDMMVNMPVTALDYAKIYRVSAQVCAPALAVTWVDVVACNGNGCRSCGPATGCRFAAVSTLLAAGSPYLKIFEVVGRTITLTATHELTEWTVDGANAVLCLSDYVFIVSDGEALPILRSRDGGATRVALAGNADMAAHPPRAIEALGLGLILVGGEDGYIYMSTDQGDSFSTVSAGAATTQNINKIKICTEDPSVVYAVGASNALIKSEDGGYTWYALTGPSAGDALIDIEVYNALDILIINDDAELWQSEDGGETFTQQSDLEGISVTPVGVGIAACGCTVGTGFVVEADSVTSFVPARGMRVFRNVNSGSHWREIQGSPLAVAVGNYPRAVACCNENLALVVGGNGTDEGFYALISNGYGFDADCV